MRFLPIILAGAFAPIVGLAAPAGQDDLTKRDNLCNLSAPPETCQPDPTVTVEETALRAYNFYRAFVLDGNPRLMFSLIDSVYKQNTPGYASGPNAIWPLFCGGRVIGTEQNTDWCFDASTNMSYARYSTTDRWHWVDGCIHEHWDQGERIPAAEKCYQLPDPEAAAPEEDAP
ncbi:uncharacterized protein DNG_08929 [Cephalotrichum gorgonifer]|uniref:Uncharacterized protein n=1 Tax=Cephalotrichum gorgonifer TaxID=2041049 RepID=A0AAE8SYT7_9PEZI|nr:uncharacterized protein DNG_08929 [Cephalotrichum gorgonifer]